MKTAKIKTNKKSKSAKSIKIDTDKTSKKTVSIDGMSLYELCRWASLMDAMEVIEDKCIEKNIDFDKIYLDQIEILKYVDSINDDIYNKALSNQI